MPTNDERREVAARLRDFDSLRETFRESPLCAFLDALGIEGYLDWEDVWGYLADLIEPEERTCKRIAHGLERNREIATVSWTCSKCGKHMGRDHNFCPSCGARVVKEEA